MTRMQDGFNAAREIESFSSLDTIENFPKYWQGVAASKVTATANHVWGLVKSLPTQRDIEELKGLLEKLNALDSTHDMMKELHASQTSSVPKTPGFTLVSTEAYHVTISNQARQIKRIVEKASFVTGSSRIIRARNLVGFFAVEERDDLCAEIQSTPEVAVMLRSGEVGQQMIGLILATQSALKSCTFQNARKSAVDDAQLLVETSFPKILAMYNASVQNLPLMSSAARARASELMVSAQQLAVEHHRRFDHSSYTTLKSLVEAMEGIRDCPALDVARSKLKVIAQLQDERDYMIIRSKVPEVEMIHDSRVVDHCIHVVQCVREMTSSKDVARLRVIISELSDPPLITGIPDLERIKHLLAIEESLDDLTTDSETQEALWKIGNRLDGSSSIFRARSRLTELKIECQTNHVFDLFSAARHGDVKLIQHFLEAGAKVNDRNLHGDSALMAACSGGHLDAIEFLLASGADISAHADNGYNCLHFAVCAGQLQVIQVLLPKMKTAHMSINSRVSTMKSTALHLAAKHGQADIAYFLIENDASPEAGDANSNTAFLCALAAKQGDTASFLVESGCNISARNADHYTGLHFSSRHANIDMAKRCVAAGLDVNLRTRAGLTPLHMACTGALQDEMVKVSVGDAGRGSSASKALATPKCNPHVDMCFWLLHRRAININARDNRGNTPLHHAASGASLQLVKLFLSYGANPFVQNYDGRGYVALEVAKDDAIVELLGKYMAMPQTSRRDSLSATRLRLVHSCDERCDFDGCTSSASAHA